MPSFLSKFSSSAASQNLAKIWVASCRFPGLLRSQVGMDSTKHSSLFVKAEIPLESLELSSEAQTLIEKVGWKGRSLLHWLMQTAFKGNAIFFFKPICFSLQEKLLYCFVCNTDDLLFLTVISHHTTWHIWYIEPLIDQGTCQSDAETWTTTDSVDLAVVFNVLLQLL